MGNLIETCRKYFELCESKDLSVIDALFADNACLRDWEIEAKGKMNVLAAYQAIFNNANRIQVVAKHIYQSENTVIAEIEIFINNESEPLKVVDVIVFDESNHIKAIRAYKG